VIRFRSGLDADSVVKYGRQGVLTGVAEDSVVRAAMTVR
jgi:hypothetical protein